MKFRGAAQGPRALVAELIAGELARALQLPMPQLALIELDPLLARSEPDAEIQALLAASAGLNVAMDYLPGAMNFEAAMAVDAQLAARIVWFDALISNVDRTARNPNLLRWHKQVYLIDHGAALYFHHNWPTANPRSPFAAIKNHVLLRRAGDLREADADLAPKISQALLHQILVDIPDAWLDVPRDQYVDYFTQRLAAPRAFAEEAERARHL